MMIRDRYFSASSGRPPTAISWVLLILAGALLNNAVAQQAEVGRVDPRMFGFDIPPGPVRVGDGRRVTTDDEQGKAVVAKVHVEVGDNRIVMLPDGTLVARQASRAPYTEREFVPATKKEIAERMLATSLKGFENIKTKETKRYLYFYNTSDEFARAASNIMETMFRGMMLHAQAQKIAFHEPEVPMVVIMFRTEDEYQRYQRMPPGMVAYYHILNNHVVFYERPRVAPAKAELAVQQAISTMAHEGAHQILHNTGVQQRLSLWPMWLAEGMAEYYAPTSTGKRLKWKGAGQVNDMRMSELEEYLKSKSTDGLDGKTIEITVGARKLTSTGYASAWALTHHLAKNHRASFNKFVNQVSRLGPLEGYQSNVAVFQDYFGKDLAGQERRMVLHLRKLPYTPPFADLPHYVAIIWYPNGRTLQRDANLFRSSETANRWRREAMAKIPPDQRKVAKSEVRTFPNRARADGFRRQWLGGR